MASLGHRHSFRSAYEKFAPVAKIFLFNSNLLILRYQLTNFWKNLFAEAKDIHICLHIFAWRTLLARLDRLYRPASQDRPESYFRNSGPRNPRKDMYGSGPWVLVLETIISPLSKTEKRVRLSVVSTGRLSAYNCVYYIAHDLRISAFIRNEPSPLQES